MKILLSRNFILIVLALFVSITGIQARDYYVRNGPGIGDGLGLNAQNAAAYSTLSGVLLGHTVSNGETLNIYFESSATPYAIGSSPLTFNTTPANVNGLTVSFQPTDPDASRDQVIFDGANTNIRFIATTSGSTMSLLMSRITIQNFSSSAGAVDTGGNSLFANGTTGATATTIGLENVHINNIISLRNPLIAVNSGTFNVNNSLIENVQVRLGSYGSFIETTDGSSGATLNFVGTTFSKCASLATGTYENMFFIENANSSLILSNSVITECRFPRTMFRCNQSTGYIDIRDTKFIDNDNNNPSLTGTLPLIAYINSASAFNVIDCEFTGNVSYKDSPMIMIENNSWVEMSGCTFSGNSFSSVTTNAHLIRLNSTNGAVSIYNNTFSGNQINNAIYIAASNASGAIFNNTFYNSKGITKANLNYSVMNNLLLGTGAAVTTSGTIGENSTQRNVIGNNFYETGTATATLNIPNAIDNLTSLSNNTNNASKPKVHLFSYLNGAASPFMKLGREANLTGYEDKLKFDQIGNARPASISVGSIDDPDFLISMRNYTYIYNPDESWDPSNTLTIDLHDMGLPLGADPATNVTFTMNPIGNGTLTQRAGTPYIFDFFPLEDSNNPGNPAQGIVGTGQTTTYTVSYTNPTTGVTYVGTGTLRIAIISTNQPPMGNLTDGEISCITEFSPVEFASKYKFITGLESGISIVDPGTGQQIYASNNNTNNMDGFSIPLVGDLNGDGKPEIIALSHTNGSTAFAETRHLYIINGQTGKIIIKHELPVQMNTRGGTAYHGTPSAIAILDSDNNGLGEIVVAMGYHTTGTDKNWDKRLICYEVNERTFESEFSITETAATDSRRLTMKWVSDKRYDWVENSNGSNMTQCNFNFTTSAGQTISDTQGYYFDSNIYFSSPLPQVVDFDGDGTPEIFVYNKIYNAQTGELIMCLEDLGPAANLDSYKNTNYDEIRGYSFVGRGRTSQSDGGNPSTTGGDTNVPFAYIYDIDRDGTYDVAAGGKVYYNINLKSGSYDVLGGKPSSDPNALVLGDGYTGVADINMDGIAEVVVATRTPGNAASSSPLILTVWNPGFYKLDDQGNIVEGDKIPRIIAQRTIPIEYTTYGNHSYIYIGDLDGLEQEVPAIGGGTQKKKYPEITILSGRMYGTDNTTNTVPLHPNVASNIRPYLRANGSIPYTGGGSMISFTWDGRDTDENSAAITETDKLKVSFILEHGDFSNNTGFTLFDFDNDGKMDICYRDQTYLRIISADAPYYISNSTTPNNNPGTPGYLIKFRQEVNSNTGFEYPVIADIDGDASADIVVMGNNTMTYYGHVFAVEGNRVQFAPAPKVWNQFMYSPLKVNEDLTIPRKVFNPLSDDFAYIKDKTNPDVKDYIYNNTITQTTIFGVFRDGNTGVDYWAPVVRQPDAVVKAIVNSSAGTLEVTIRNTGTATLNGANPIGVYYGNKSTNDFTSANFVTGTTIGADLFSGEERTISIPVSDTNRDFIIRVSDASVKSDGTFDSNRFGEVYLDCVWETNIAYASSFQPNDDALVTEPHKVLTFNVLDNDVFPASCTNLTVTFGQLPAESGSIITDSDGNVKYTAPATTPNGVVEIPYTVDCGGSKKSASIYVFVLENSSNTFAACYGNTIVIDLNENPIGTTFVWYQGNTEGSPTTSAPGTIHNLDRNREFYVEPKVPYPYASVIFPIYTLTVRVIGDEDGAVQMRWTGNANDKDWHNPLNWVEVINSIDQPAEFAPSKCVDVTIPKGTDYYPEIKAAAEAGMVHLEDRAMLANTHKLDYDSATVAVNFTADERNNRWVMYSAPMRKVYSGDFILLDENGKPKTSPPAVYMSFFQSKNPDNPNSVAEEQKFTKTFGNVGVLLYLGKSFNIWINKDVDQTTPFEFPSSYEKYDYYVHGIWGTEQIGDSSSHTLSRYDGAVKVNGQFIADEAKSNAIYSYNATDGSFKLPPPDDEEGFQMIMIPNPFMAYLDIEEFLQENSEYLQQGYKVWKGKDDAFISYQNVPVWEDRVWVIDDNFDPAAGLDDLTNYQYVSPLQSFIVAKKDEYINQKVELTYKPETMLTTSPLGAYYQGDYKLRSITDNSDPKGLMRIKASFAGQTNTTILTNSPGASNSFTDDDSRKLFFDGRSPVSIYTLTPEKDALAINVSGEFKGKEIPVGVRLSGQGKLTFDFTGIDRFNYEVWFIDGDKEVDLGKTTSYTTDDVVTGSGTYYEINNRFKLRFGNEVLGIDDNGTESVRVRSSDGKIYVTSDELMNFVEVISTIGQPIYRSENKSTSHVIEASLGQVYMVKILTDKGSSIMKVLVK